MSNKYQEVITCKKCSKDFYREAEIISINKEVDLDQPLKVILLKKFECPDCKEKDYTIRLAKN